MSQTTRTLIVRPDLPTLPLDAPHMLLETRPAEVWQHVNVFLETLFKPTPIATLSR